MTVNYQPEHQKRLTVQTDRKPDKMGTIIHFRYFAIHIILHLTGLIPSFCVAAGVVLNAITRTAKQTHNTVV